tara:strand:- start:17 stop:442 length:426 start_codon:yes stop_codon:yes gene_type:complete
MKKLIFITCLFFHFNAFADWVLIKTPSDGPRVYYDPSSIIKKGISGFITVKFVYQSPQLMRSRGGEEIMIIASKFEMRLDCIKYHFMGEKEFHYVDVDMTNMAFFASYDYEKDHNLIIRASQGSIARRWMDKVCKSKASNS